MDDKPIQVIRRGEFTFEMLKAIEILSLPNKGGFQYKEIAEMCNINEKTLKRWRNEENFQREIQKRVLRNLNEALADVMDSTVKRAVQGSGKHAELIMKALGILKDTHIVETKAEEYRPSNEELEAEIEILQRELDYIENVGKPRSIIEVDSYTADE